MARRGLRLRPVNSVKDIVDSTQIGVAAGTTSTVTVCAAVNSYAGGSTEVPIGAKVFGVYLFVQAASDATNANIDWYFIKRPNQVVNPTPGATGGTLPRKFILHEEKGLPGTYNAGSAPLTYRGFIRIPRGRQSFQEGDLAQVVIRGAQQYSFCIKAIFKFYQ